MKTITNKNIKLKDTKTTYFILITTCVESQPQGGFGIAEMRKRLKVLDAIEGNKETFELEDAEFETLKLCVLNMPWAVCDKEIVMFTDYIESIE